MGGARCRRRATSRAEHVAERGAPDQIRESAGSQRARSRRSPIRRTQRPGRAPRQTGAPRLDGRDDSDAPTTPAGELERLSAFPAESRYVVRCA